MKYRIGTLQIMVESIRNWYLSKNKKFEDKYKHSIGEIIVISGCIFIFIMMLLRVFYGTEITDEAYYISDAIQIMKGNIPYAYNNYSYGTGSAFLIIPFLFVYSLIVPNNEGVFLYTRICYMLFWMVCLWLGYRILRKDYKKKNALLVMAFLILYTAGAGIYNFSYNTIPAVLTYISALSIYDALEHKNRWSRIKFVISGFVLGIAFFAHPGYALAIVILGMLVIIRSKGIREKLINIGCCFMGGIIEVLIIFIPIIAQTGSETLYKGIDMMFHPYPSSPMSDVTIESKISAIVTAFKPYIILIVSIFAITFVLLLWFIKKKKITIEKGVEISLSIATIFLVSYVSAKSMGSPNLNWQFGMGGFVIAIAMIILGIARKFILYWYMAIYPAVFSVAQIIKVDSSVSTFRFNAAVPILAVVLLILLESKSMLARWITTCSVVICILAIGYSDYNYVYRDDVIWKCNYMVESGVYKGIFTTKERARDLPELEEYLNSIVDEEEQYAFRDNVPAAYLMMHKGRMIDKATWDCLNYSYEKNAPATLYAYYERRGDFPRKYIYIDYGRDEKLSCQDENFKFNEFINSYYKKTADFMLNETFYHIVVYEYNGGFDGNFDYWIKRHMYKNEGN